jgi:peptidoglycan-associated lipoprotein
MRTHASIAALAALALAATACSKKQTVRYPADPVAGPSSTRDATTPSRSAQVTTSASAGAPMSFGPVYFAFDSAAIRPEDRDELGRLGEYLDAHRDVTAVIEGHADDRGTEEYNIALGDARANAVRDYLVRLGIARHRLRTVSYGEARPVVSGSTEEAWSKNRRGELVPSDGGSGR